MKFKLGESVGIVKEVAPARGTSRQSLGVKYSYRALGQIVARFPLADQLRLTESPNLASRGEPLKANIWGVVTSDGGTVVAVADGLGREVGD